MGISDCDFKAINDHLKWQTKEFSENNSKLKNRYWLLQENHAFLKKLDPNYNYQTDYYSDEFDNKRHEYQEKRWGEWSQGDFTIEQLQEYHGYLSHNPTFNYDQDLLNEYLDELSKEEQTERKELLAECYEWLAKLGFSKKREAAYLLKKYDKELPEFLNLEQLREYCDSLSEPDFSLNPYGKLRLVSSNTHKKPSSEATKPVLGVCESKPNKSKGARQITREQVLADWLANYQASNPHINIQSLPFDKEYMLKLLAEKSEVFHGLSLSSFNTFWRLQGFCDLKRGRKPNS